MISLVRCSLEWELSGKPLTSCTFKEPNEIKVAVWLKVEIEKSNLNFICILNEPAFYCTMSWQLFDKLKLYDPTLSRCSERWKIRLFRFLNYINSMKRSQNFFN